MSATTRSDMQTPTAASNAQPQQQQQQASPQNSAVAATSLAAAAATTLAEEEAEYNNALRSAINEGVAGVIGEVSAVEANQGEVRPVLGHWQIKKKKESSVTLSYEGAMLLLEYM